MTIAIPVKAYARIAGLLYLIIAVAGGFSIAYVPSVIVVDGDAAATVANLLSHQGLFGLGVFADVLVMLAEIVLSVMLFVLFKPTSPTLSLISMVARLTMVVVMAANVLINVMPLVLLSGPVAGFTPEQLQGTVMLLINAHQYGVYVWDVFFGFHLAALGYLTFKSGYFPSLLGVALMVGSFGYFVEGLAKVTFVENAALGTVVVGLLVVASISELAFAFWLLIKSLNVTAWETKALVAA
jgi:hypothetical protein